MQSGAGLTEPQRPGGLGFRRRPEARALGSMAGQVGEAGPTLCRQNIYRKGLALGINGATGISGGFSIDEPPRDRDQ